MSQLAVRHTPAVGGLDLVREGSSLKMDEGYLTAEILSLKCKKRARVRGGSPMHGWWADNSLGSMLWTFLGEPINKDTAARARTEILDALKWMIDAKICASIDVTTEILSHAIVGRIVLHRQDGSADEIRRWEMTESEMTYA